MARVRRLSDRGKQLTQKTVSAAAKRNANKYLQARELAKAGYRPEQLVKAGYRPEHLKYTFGLSQIARSRLTPEQKRVVYSDGEKIFLSCTVRDMCKGKQEVEGIRSLLAIGVTQHRLIDIGLNSKTVKAEARKLGIKEPGIK